MDTKQGSAEVQMPVDRLSYSGLTTLLRNPLIFKLKYILGVYDRPASVNAMVGRAGHEALKLYYGGNPDIPVPANRDEARHMAIAHGLKYLEEYDDVYINYGWDKKLKKPRHTREEMYATYTKGINFYFAEEPEYNEILICEEKLVSTLHTVDGQELALPAVGVPDIVHKRKDGGIEIIDVKFTKSFTEYDEEDWEKIVQSQFLWHLLRGSKNLTATRMLFREVKTSANKDGGPQVRDWAVPFDHEQYRIIFYNLYNDAIRFLRQSDPIFLPNISDVMDGEQAGMLYAQGLVSGDMSDVEVLHKVKDVALTSKKFVSSRLDTDINKHLEPQEKIKLRLAEFGIPVEPVNVVKGSSITQYQFKVSAGIPMSRLGKHKADIARAIEAKGEIRILAPIPGTSLVGVEVASEERKAVVLSSKDFEKGTLRVPIGVSPDGTPHFAALNEMPHLLIAGATGSGKSVTIDTILTALTKQMTPEQMRLVLIDPKRVELARWGKDKHLKGGKIAYEYADALLLLKGLTDEMESRYKLLEAAKVRNVDEYRRIVLIEGKKDIEKFSKGGAVKAKKLEPEMPYIIAVVDEFADLILQGRQFEKRKKKNESLVWQATQARVQVMAREMARQGIKFTPPKPDDEMPTVEDMIVRLASMARAVGIHLIIATQRPSVDVITGLIKANFPTRIALTTASPTDSKVILGVEGAEKLTGKGDMLFMHPGGGITRLQGFITE